MAAASDYQKIHAQISSFLSPHGLEAYPFKMGWYYEAAGPDWHLQYPDDTLAFVILGVERSCSGPEDHLDECIGQLYQSLREDYPQLNDSPKLWVQIAGHVAGGAYYYRRKDVEDDPWGSKTIYGISVHPTIGEKVYFRGACIFEDIQVPDLPKKNPPDCVPDNAQRIELLDRVNVSFQEHLRLREMKSSSEKGT